MTTPPLVVGDIVKLTASLRGMTQYRGKLGELVKITPSAAGSFANVVFCMDAETNATAEVHDVLLNYLARAEPTGKRTRRPALNLHEPKDDRTEAQKEDEAESFLRSFGYEVQRVGQIRKAAVCYGCMSDEQKAAKQEQRMPRRIGPTLCPTHHRPVYSMSTGSTEGVADWIIRHPSRWQRQCLICYEWKRDGNSPRRAKQIEFSAAGWYEIGSTLQAVCAAIVTYERSVLRIEPLPEILAKGEPTK